MAYPVKRGKINAYVGGMTDPLVSNSKSRHSGAYKRFFVN